MNYAASIRFSKSLLASSFCAWMVSTGYATVVDWGPTGPLLNAFLIQQSGTVTFANVGGMGVDLVVTTSNLSGGTGMGNFGDGTGASGSSFWFGGGVSSTDNPNSLIAFKFYQTGTSNPAEVTGLHFSFQDSESGERYKNFGYYDGSGSFHGLANNSGAFSGSPGINTGLAGNILENAASPASGSQPGKGLTVDLASVPVTGFSFSPYGTSGGAGSVEMTGLGDLQAVPEAGTAFFGIALTGILATMRRRKAVEPIKAV